MVLILVLINFSFLPLDKTDADMTYVRMNSRGLPLTAFENFKANIEKMITFLGGEK